MTHRQFLAWGAWLSLQWNRPNRTDYYLMGVACEVRRLFRKNPKRIHLDQLRIKFKVGDGKVKGKLTPAQQDELREESKRKALALVGKTVVVKQISRAEMEAEQARLREAGIE